MLWRGAGRACTAYARIRFLNAAWGASCAICSCRTCPNDALNQLEKAEAHFG